MLCYGRRTRQKATAACRAQVKCETYYFNCYRCPRRRRHFSSAGTRNQAETTKGSVQQKLNTLRQLAAEILAIVAEEEIEGEIERADFLEESVQLVIANIENALSPKVVCSNVKKTERTCRKARKQMKFNSGVILRRLQLQRRIPFHLCGEILRLNCQSWN